MFKGDWIWLGDFLFVFLKYKLYRVFYVYYMYLILF